MKPLNIGLKAAQDIDAQVAKILRGLGNPPPPLKLAEVLELLKLNKGFYSSQDDGALHEVVSRAIIAGKQIIKRPTLLLDAFRKWDIKAFYVPDKKRILLDSSEPELKWRWNEAHEVVHSVVPWHQEFLHGDNRASLSLDCHKEIEAEANYGAGCVWQAGLAHFGSLFWPTPGTLKVWETFIPWSSRRWECGNRC